MDNSKTSPVNKATSQIREPSKDTDFLQPLTYTLQDCGGWYAKDADPASEHGGHLLKVPATLQIQHVYKQGIKSNQVLTSGNAQGHQQLFTGLRQTNEQDWLYGDVPEYSKNGVAKSLILLEFSPDRYQFRLFLFDGYYPKRSSRQSEIGSIISAIIKSRNPFSQNTGIPPSSPLKNSRVETMDTDSITLKIRKCATRHTK